MNRRSIPLIALNIAIGLVVVGATAAYGALSTRVELTVDGQTQSIRTFGTSVSDVLEARDVTLREDDRINLAPSHKLSDGDAIVVEYAKPLTLAVDGEVSEHTVFTPTVAEALDHLEVEVPEGAYLSGDPDATIPRTGDTLVVSSTKDVTVIADGEKQTITTNRPTAAGVVAEAGITLDADDEITDGADRFVKPDEKVRVVRIEKVDKTETVDVKFPVEVVEDPDAMEGEVEIVSAGVKGSNREDVTLVYADGELRERIVREREVLAEPVKQVEKRGTQKNPVSGVWAALARCESGGNPRANNGGKYFGLYQFSLSTWRSVGGAGNPMDASPAEQTKRAKILQAKAGWGQWPSCSRKIGVR